MDKRISVIIPVYNAETSLKKCLDSVCTQTYKNLEIILINDGSQDKSLEICRTYSAGDSRIVLLSQENSGPSATRNRAIDMATGDYLAFVDSDDYIEPNMAERMLAVATEYDSDIVICSFFEEDGETVRKHCFSYRNGFYDEEACRNVAIDLIDNNSRARIPPYSCIRLVRKELFTDPSLRYNPKVKRSEDYLLWTQVHFRIKSMYLLGDEPLYHYVYNAASITKSYLPEYWPMCRELYAELQQKLPHTAQISKKLQAMLIQRSLIALHNAVLADGRQFDSDAQEILDDKELIRAAWRVGLFKNSTRAKIYALLVMLRMKFLIKRIFLAPK